MNTISGFGAYQSSFYQNTLQERKEKNSVEEKKTDKTEKNPVQLSSAAKKLLKEIQKKYGDMDMSSGRRASLRNRARGKRTSPVPPPPGSFAPPRASGCWWAGTTARTTS